MKLYVQFMIILVFSFLGEAISTIFHLPIPGSIIGLILLFLALEFKLIRLRHIHTVGNFLLANMTILFLPAAVGIMERFDAIKDYLLPIIIVILGAIFLNILVIGFVVQFVKQKFEGDYIDAEGNHDGTFFQSYFWYYVINCSIFNWNADLSEISSSNHNPTVGSYRIDYCLFKNDRYFL